MPTKVCSKCLKEKDVLEFVKKKNSSDGFGVWCKCCMKEYYKSNAERKKEYYKANSERIKEYLKANSERIKEYKKEYHSVRRKNDDYYRFISNFRSRIYHAFKLYSQNGKTNSCSEYGIDFSAIYDRIGPRPDSSFHLDHIIPISLFDLDNPEHVRLAHVPENLRWIPGKENMEKNDSVDFTEVLSSSTLRMICQQLGIDYTSHIQKVA